MAPDPFFNKVHFRSFQEDEGATFNDGSGGGSGASELTVDGYFLFDTEALSTDNFDPTVMWVGYGSSTADAVVSQVQGVFPFKNAAFSMTDYHWWTLFSNATDPNDSPIIVPETWYHVELWTSIYGSVGSQLIDYYLKVDGTPYFDEVGVDVSSLTDTTIRQAGFGADGTGQFAQGSVYVDDARQNATLIDNFDVGSPLAAWDDQTGDVSVSTDFSFGGAQSMKAHQTSDFFTFNAGAFVTKQI